MHSENICSPCLGTTEEYIKKEEDFLSKLENYLKFSRKRFIQIFAAF